MHANPVILFDGSCNLCNRTVRFIINHDPVGFFKFVSLQSSAGKKLIQEHGINMVGVDSFILVERDSYYTRSTAALRICRHLSGMWRYATFLSIIPVPIRDWAYDQVATNRYQWFGRQEFCPLPEKAELDRFLD